MSLTPDGPRLVGEASGSRLLRALSDVPAELEPRLDRFDSQTRDILDRIEAGDERALEGFTDDDTAERSRRLGALFERFGDEARIELAGTLPIGPESTIMSAKRDRFALCRA